MDWHVYVLLSAGDSSTYVGITTDLERRLKQHNGELPGGARSTTRGRPWRVARTHGPFPDRAEAQATEYRIKRKRGSERLTWSAEA
jgi:predicted GIY-YIG superfamily endonuclease